MAYTLEEAKETLKKKWGSITECPYCKKPLKDNVGRKSFGAQELAGRQMSAKVYEIACTNPKCPEHPPFNDHLAVD